MPMFKELVSILLQEEKSRQNRSIMRVANKAFAANPIKAREKRPTHKLRKKL